MPKPKKRPAPCIDPEIVERLAVAMYAVSAGLRKTTDEHKALSRMVCGGNQRVWFRRAQAVLERLAREGVTMSQG